MSGTGFFVGKSRGFISVEIPGLVHTNKIYSGHEIIPETTEKIIRHLPMWWGNVTIDNDHFLDAIIYICENGCKWRALPAPFGPWHTIYVRINRWAKKGVLERVFLALRAEQIAVKPITVVSLDSTSVKVHPDAAGSLKKTANRRWGRAGDG
jgi:transposase